MSAWRVVPSLPFVEASESGMLRVIPYLAPMPMGGARTYGGVATRGQWDGDRFVYTVRGKTYKVARLVCEAFHGRAPGPYSVCMHLNEDARDNRASNLAWGTQKENLNAPGFIAYCRGRVGSRNPAYRHKTL